MRIALPSGMPIRSSILLPVFFVGFGIAPAEAQRPTRLPPPSAAQRPGPAVHDTSTLGVQASIGKSTTRSQFLGNGLEVHGGVEGYVTPRVSIRGQMGAAWWDVTGLSYAATIRPVYLIGNVVYNWQSENWRPYVTGGAGLYRYGFTEAGVAGSKTKGGIAFGGGLERFVTEDATITGEAQFHKVGLVPTNRAVLGFKGSFWSFSVGAKKYF